MLNEFYVLSVHSLTLQLYKKPYDAQIPASKVGNYIMFTFPDMSPASSQAKNQAIFIVAYECILCHYVSVELTFASMMYGLWGTLDFIT